VQTIAQDIHSKITFWSWFCVNCCKPLGYGIKRVYHANVESSIVLIFI